jgi:hypothetical protein
MHVRLAIAIALSGGILAAQTTPAPPRDRSVALIQGAVVRALNFERGDIRSLNKVQGDFTVQGWREFQKHLQGFLDNTGAPTFSSKFVPAGNALLVSKENGILRLKIPGTLTQTQGGSKTIYRLRIDVQAAGTAPKIEHLEQITCSGTAAVSYCM